MRYQGKITAWKDDRGFGFITQKPERQKVFVHISSLVNRKRRPIGNESVSYELRTDTQGRTQAVNVIFSDEPIPLVYSKMRGKGSLIFASAFLIFVAGATLIGKLPLFLLGIYLITSAIAFCSYAFDKSAAKKGKWRTQEGTLHLFSMVGGWPGALVAQKLLRHKSRKRSFQIVFWITVVINCGVLGYLFSPLGAAVFRSIFFGLEG